MKKMLFTVLILLFVLFVVSCGDEKKKAPENDADSNVVADEENKVDDEKNDDLSDAVLTESDETPDNQTPDENIITPDEEKDDITEEPDEIPDIEYPDLEMNESDSYSGTYGWEIMKDTYYIDPSFDALSFEWDYFMIHNEDDSFSGSVGYLVSNPRNKKIAGNLFGKLVPGGGNIAIAGQFDKTLAPVADYENFDPDNGHTTTISGEERSLWVENTDKGYWGKMTPNHVDNTMLLEGKTGNFEWELTVRQDWTELTTGSDTFVQVTDNKIDTKVFGIPVAQEWNVHMFWPRTKITGWIKDLRDSKVYDIDAHGYRENSWGRWAFNQGGWDFGTMSDIKSKVMFGWQTYHFNSTRLDYLDLGFIDEGEYKLVNFRADMGQLGWKHDNWSFDPVARQCVPRDSVVVGKNDKYKVVANITIGEGQVPMLSDATDIVKNYVIMIQIPWFEGHIVRLSDNKIIATFSGRGGGEFSTERAKEGTTFISDLDCIFWGSKFSVPIPQ
ncbi:MAG TPA: hypothetical protein PL195_03255 [bacterium]|nr:hypothetical protein [bacterium]HQJ59879.1 hypothetical protein [bacterium]